MSYPEEKIQGTNIEQKPGPSKYSPRNQQSKWSTVLGKNPDNLRKLWTFRLCLREQEQCCLASQTILHE